MDIEKYLEDNNYVSSSDLVSMLFFTTLCNAVYNQCLEDVKSKGQKYTNPSNPNDVKYFIHSDQFKNLKKP